MTLYDLIHNITDYLKLKVAMTVPFNKFMLSKIILLKDILNSILDELKLHIHVYMYLLFHILKNAHTHLYGNFISDVNQHESQCFRVVSIFCTIYC